MKKEITDKEAIGKTITDIIYSSLSDQMVICFDDSFTVFSYERGYEDDVEIINERMDNPLDLDIDLIKAGILTKMEYEKKRAEKRAAWQKAQDLGDREEYERLKSKFEPDRCNECYYPFPHHSEQCSHR